MPTEATVVHRDYYRKRFNLQFLPIAASKTLRAVDFASVLSVDPANFDDNVVFTLPALDQSPAGKIDIVFESDSSSSHTFSLATASGTATLNSGSLLINGQSFQVVSQSTLVLGHVKKGSAISIVCTCDAWYVSGCVSLVDVVGLALTVPGQVLLVDGAAFEANASITLPVAATMKGVKFSIIWSSDTNSSYTATIARHADDTTAVFHAQGLVRNGSPLGKLLSATSINVWKPQLGSRIDVQEVDGDWHLSGSLVDDNLLTESSPLNIRAEYAGLSFDTTLWDLSGTTILTLPESIDHFAIGWSMCIELLSTGGPTTVRLTGCSSVTYDLSEVGDNAISSSSASGNFFRAASDNVGDRIDITIPDTTFALMILTKVAHRLLSVHVHRNVLIVDATAIAKFTSA